MENEWLLFLAQLPATPSSLRVNVWRRLRDSGSTTLQNGVWVLPRSEETTTRFERLLAYVRQHGATGQVFVVGALSQEIHQDLVARFQADREQEYVEFLHQCEAFIAELETETRTQMYSFAELEEGEQDIQRLRKWIARIQKRDFFRTQRSEDAAAAFQACHRSLMAYTREVYATEGVNVTPGAAGLSVDILLTEQEEHHDND
jgi:type IV secretory pathway VirJ component